MMFLHIYINDSVPSSPEKRPYKNSNGENIVCFVIFVQF